MEADPDFYESVRARLLKTREKLAQDLAKVDAAILALKDLSGFDFDGEPEPTAAPRSKERSRNILKPKEIADRAREVILEARRPLVRSELLELLEAKGVLFDGSDKSKNLGTIMWRFQDRFVQLKGHGYWPKDVDLTGVYIAPRPKLEIVA